MEFKKWLRNEMAWFTVPDEINIKVPYKDGGLMPVKMVDMLFEKNPELHRDKVSGSTMNQGSKFVAPIPNSDRYLAYHGNRGGISSQTISKKEAMDLSKGEYNVLPEEWYEKALLIGPDDNQINL